MKVIRKHHCGFAFIDHDSGYLENQDIQVLEEIMTTYKKGYYKIDFNDEDVSDKGDGFKRIVRTYLDCRF